MFDGDAAGASSRDEPPGDGRPDGGRPDGRQLAGELSGGERSGGGRSAGGPGRRTRRPGARAGGHPEDAPGDPETVARAICLRLLTVQPRTRAELAVALARRDVPDDVAEQALSRFTEVGLIDDRAFAEAWVGSRHAGRGLARRALAAELRRRGVDGEIVGEAVATLDAETEEHTARELVARRLPGTRRLEPAARVRRLVAMLARKGYPPALALRIVHEQVAADGVDPDELTGLEDAEPDDAD